MRALSVVFLIVICASSPAHAVTIDMVTVGNAGNAADPTTGSLYGAVDYEYRIGKYEITIAQYAAFLNATANTDVFNAYHPSMGTDMHVAGIARSGESGSYTYSVIGPFGEPYGQSPANRPITYVSWVNAARFANWMANGQPTGDQNGTTTEDGAYTLVGMTSSDAPVANAINPNTGVAPAYRLPTRDEWYKAAYYDPTKNGTGGYWRFATQSDTAPGNQVGDSANQANHFKYFTGAGFTVTQAKDSLAVQNYLSDVGAFSNSASSYGTFDQTGNVFELNDTIVGPPSGYVIINDQPPPVYDGIYRDVRGGAWLTNDRNGGVRFSSSSTSQGDQLGADALTGFRLASPVAVPEPSAWAMGVGGLAYGGLLLSRRHKRIPQGFTKGSP